MFATDPATARLNPRQRDAVDHGDEPLLVVAGAGTGKTATLAARLAGLVERGTEPTRICLLTFSRRASSEMVARAGHWVGPAAASQVVAGTFHSVAQRLLHRYGALVGLGPAFSVLDAADSVELMRLVRHDLGLGSGPHRFPRAETLVAVMSQVANSQVPLTEVLARSFPWCTDDGEGIRRAFAAYTERKRARHLADFDDLLLLVGALGQSPAGGEVVGNLFDHVLVDEYQDVNQLQDELLSHLRPGGRGLTVVGDPGQAIYGFRSATTAAIGSFARRHPDARVIRLEQNYRSSMPILALANQVMAEGDETLRTQLWSEVTGRARPVIRTCSDELAQAEAVCDSVLAHREEGIDLRRQVVLFRTGHHSSELELALSGRAIPFVKYGGLKFLEAAHVKDLLALVRVLENPDDELAWFRALQLVEGVGPATARQVMTRLGLGEADHAWFDPAAPQPLARMLAALPTLAAPGGEGLGELRQALDECCQMAAGGAGLGAQLDRLRRWLDPVLTRRYDHPQARLADLDHLTELAGPGQGRAEFLAGLVLDPPSSTADLAGPPSLDDDWLVLSTVHSAKGGEWDVVHVIHASDGMFPSDLATGDAEGIAEERRLFYVAVTRARRALEVNVPLRYHHHRPGRRRGPRADRHSYAQASRFLSPAVKDLADLESTTLPGHAGVADEDDPAAPPAGGQAVEAVDAMLSRLWA